MGYRIQYGKEKKGRLSRFLVLLSMWFCLFLFATRLWWPVGWERLQRVLPAWLPQLPVLWDGLCAELCACGSWQEAFHTFFLELGHVF